jgi:hypothetical protein
MLSLMTPLFRSAVKGADGVPPALMLRFAPVGVRLTPDSTNAAEGGLDESG